MHIMWGKIHWACNSTKSNKYHPSVGQETLKNFCLNEAPFTWTHSRTCEADWISSDKNIHRVFYLLLLCAGGSWPYTRWMAFSTDEPFHGFQFFYQCNFEQDAITAFCFQVKLRKVRFCLPGIDNQIPVEICNSLWRCFIEAVFFAALILNRNITCFSFWKSWPCSCFLLNSSDFHRFIRST